MRVKKTLLGTNYQSVRVTPAMEQHIVVLEEFVAGDNQVTPVVEKATEALVTAGVNLAHPRRVFYAPPVLNYEEFLSVKVSVGRLNRMLENANYDDLSLTDQCDVIYDMNICIDTCRFGTSLETLETTKYRHGAVLTVIRSSWNKLKEYLYETSDTTVSLMVELISTFKLIEQAHRKMYGTNRYIKFAGQVDYHFNKVSFDIKQPSRGYMGALAKMRTVFLEDSLLLSLARTIYGSVETLSVSGRGTSDQLVRNIKELQYNYISAISDKSRVTNDGQEHVLKGVGVVDITLKLEEKQFDINYQTTDMIPYEPTFLGFREVLHTMYDTNTMALEDKVSHTLENYNEIMTSLDKMELTRDSLDQILKVVDSQLDLDTRVLVKIVEQTMKEILFIANAYGKAIDSMENK